MTLLRTLAFFLVTFLPLAVIAPAFAEEDFPIVGNYTQNAPCKGDGTDGADTKVRITTKEIESNVGLCQILNTKHDGKTIAAHVECQLAGGPLMGDVTFTLRPDNTVEFIDRDSNYNAILYKCPN